MIDLKLGDDWDLSVDPSQELAVTDTAEEVAQSAGLTLGALYGEYFIDGEFGTKIITEILTKTPSAARAEREIRRSLSVTEELIGISNVEMVPDNDKKKLTGTMTLNTIHGEIGLSV